MVAAAIVDYLLTLLLGALVATGELVSRYKDAPAKALRSVPGRVYLAVNGGGSIAALLLIHALNIDFGLQGGAERAMAVLVAGVGSIAFFRTSLFNVTIRDTTIGIGPNVLLVIILTALDRGVDRERARGRSESVARIMDGFDYDKAKVSLTEYCLKGLMQNATDDDEKAIADVMRELDNPLNKDLPKEIKAYIFGLNLMNIVGEDVLDEAAQRVKPLFGAPTASESEQTQPITTEIQTPS